jgi:glycosyltransferase involved in cell wall biosynthesis
MNFGSDDGNHAFTGFQTMHETTPLSGGETAVPILSVILLVRGPAALLAATLASLGHQSCPRWELLAIIAADTPEDDAVLVQEAALADPRIRILREAGATPWAARNLGAMVARASLLAFAEAGDLWVPGKLATHLALHRDSPDLTASYGRIAFIAPDASVLVGARRHSVLHDRALTPRDVLGCRPPCTTGNLVVRRQSFLVEGGFDVTLCHAQGQDLIARLLAQGGWIEGIDAVLTGRRHRLSLPASVRRMQAGWRQVIARHAHGRDALRLEALQCRRIVKGVLASGERIGQALPPAWQGLRLDAGAFLGGWRQGCGLLWALLWAAMMPPAMRQRLWP